MLLSSCLIRRLGMNINELLMIWFVLGVVAVCHSSFVMGTGLLRRQSKLILLTPFFGRYKSVFVLYLMLHGE